MDEMTISEMFGLQRALQERHPEWGGMVPERARPQFLWAFEEMGEVVAIFKKKGTEAILSDPEVRACFLEEMSDVLMYLNDVMMMLGVTPEELSEAYRGKFDYNMKRDWEKQNQALYQHSNLMNSDG